MSSQKYTGIFMNDVTPSGGYRDPKRPKKGKSKPEKPKSRGKRGETVGSELKIGVVSYDK